MPAQLALQEHQRKPTFERAIGSSLAAHPAFLYCILTSYGDEYSILMC